MSVILLLYLFVYIFSFIYILHIIIDILLSFNLRNCSCFRFWVFCLVFYLRNPRRGFFSLFPTRYTHIPLHFYDLVSGSGFSAGFSVSRTQLVGFSARFPLATPTSCQLTTQKRQESPSCRSNNLIRLQVLPWSHFFPRQYGMRSIPGSLNPSKKGSDNSPWNHMPDACPPRTGVMGIPDENGSCQEAGIHLRAYP